MFFFKKIDTKLGKVTKKRKEKTNKRGENLFYFLKNQDLKFGRKTRRNKRIGLGLVLLIFRIFGGRNFFSQNTRTNGQNNQSKSSNSTDIQNTPSANGKSVNNNPHTLLRENVGMTSVGEQTMSQETTLVIIFEIGVARTGLVLSILENPLLFISESFNEEHDQEGTSSHEGQRLGDVIRSQNENRESLSPEQERLENRDETKTENFPNELVFEHGELAHNFPTIIFTSTGVATTTPEIECHAAAPHGDTESEHQTGSETTNRSRGLLFVGVGNVVVHPSVDDGEDRPTTINPAVILCDFGESVGEESDEDAHEEGGHEGIGARTEGNVEEVLEGTLSEGSG